LRAGIARGRLCASVLVVPRRKTALVRALHGRRPWSELEIHGELPREEGDGGKGAQLGGARMGRGRGAILMAARSSSAPAAPCSFSACVLLAVPEKQEGGRRKEKRREKRKEEGRKNGKIIST
jgi:hypothetical protein